MSQKPGTGLRDTFLECKKEKKDKTWEIKEKKKQKRDMQRKAKIEKRKT